MYKNILIISDNLHLCKGFENIICEFNIPNVEWTFSISPFSQIEDFNLELQNNVSITNLKEDSEIEMLLKKHDLIFSIHCKQIFPEKLLSQVKCINIHPGYNPINRGWYPQVFAIINDTQIGATIHEIDAKLDHGPIIDRDFVEKNSWDTSLSLYEKVIKLEMKLLRKNLTKIIENSYKTIQAEGEGHLYLKKDFNNLCEIKLDEMQTVQKTIDKLRALTHGEYKNAYYIDKISGKKIFIKIQFEKQ
ncbi:Formyl transferase [Halpernia humi]|uniref:Formyl transferase n=1 Tax=Halpernia humi TaxID=493375 RepID=A0A1H5W4C9_9FLAO|nr:dTDP-4-amino-4,6-dideoxyglucose formyltransferase [Halpernia humi]SEF94394.1 Formyl transferase [Halpernia humi]